VKKNSVSRLSAAASVLAAGMLWGTTGTAQALAPVGADPSSVGLVRVALGGLFLLPFAAREAGGLGRLVRGLNGWILLAGLGTAGFQFLFFRGVLTAGVALGTIVAISSGPIFAGCLGAWIFKDRLAPSWWISTALAIAGCVLISLDRVAAPGRVSGVALAVGAGAAYALLGLGIKKASVPGRSIAAIALGLLIGALILVPEFLAHGSLGWAASGKGAVLAIHLGIVTATLPYLLFGRALGALPMGWVYTLGLSEPLVAALLGFLVLKESPTAAGLLGILLMTGGLFASSLSARKG